MRISCSSSKYVPKASLAVLLALAIAVPACKLLIDDEECTEDAQPVPFEILGEYRRSGATITTCRLNYKHIESVPGGDNLSAVELVITSEEDFQKYVICREDPGLNFAEHFVLAGASRAHHQCVIIREHRVYTRCDTLYYSVGIQEALCLMPEGAWYMVAVPIEYLRYHIQFDVFWEDFQ